MEISKKEIGNLNDVKIYSITFTNSNNYSVIFYNFGGYNEFYFESGDYYELAINQLSISISAASIIASPIRSLTEDVGLKNSSLQIKSPKQLYFLDILGILTIGVFPIVSKILS